MSLSSESKNLMSLELIKGIDNNGTQISAYVLCNPSQKLILQSKTTVDLTGFEIVFQKIGDISDQEHQDVLEYFEKTYMKKPLDEISREKNVNKNDKRMK